jgi:acyl-CoA synthetase (NDP forming)
LKQAGAFRAQNIEEFFDIARALERFGPYLLKGNRIGIATLPGGEAVVVTDLCQQYGFTLSQFNEETLQKLKPVSPPWGISGNPFDLGVSLQFHNPKTVYITLVEAVAEDPNVDALAIQLPSRAFKISQEFFQAFPKALKAQKPIALWLAGVSSGQHEVLEWLEEHNVVVFSSPEKTFRALLALHRLSLGKEIKREE